LTTSDILKRGYTKKQYICKNKYLLTSRL